MKTSERIVKFHELTAKIVNNKAADNAVEVMMGLVIRDIQDRGLPLTAELLDSEIKKYTEDFFQVADKMDVA